MDYNVFKKLEYRRKFFKIVGAEITITNPETDTEVGYLEQKAWKLREEMRLYTNRDKTEELFRLSARRVIDLGATYDVVASSNDELRFSLRRKGLRSVFQRDHWLITRHDAPLAELIETSTALALARRWIGLIPIAGEIAELLLNFAPQTYRLTDAENKLIATITHQKNPAVVKLTYDTEGAVTPAPDYFMGPAVCVLLATIEAGK